MIDNNPKFDFPKNFLWGASTSAHQVEGGNHNQWTVWELENAQARSVKAEYKMGHHDNWDRIKDAAQDPGNYVSGKLADHYHHYKEDFGLLQKMNMNAYRFGIEWSRVEPNEGEWDESELEHYEQYVDYLIRWGIEPIITLFHFTLPCWFADRGGFEHRGNVKYFVRYAKKIAERFHGKVRLVITINEPEVYAFESYYNGNWPPSEKSFLKMLFVMGNLAYAHKLSFREFKIIDKKYQILIAKHSVFFKPLNKKFASVLVARLSQFAQDDFFIGKVKRHCDFIGVNYYMSEEVDGINMSHSGSDKVNDLGWNLTPDDICPALERIYKKHKLPIIITENGLADAGDEHRKWWIMQTIVGMQKAIKNGVNIRGYLHWSLMDNFEWAYGKWPRFGLAAVNYKTGERKLRPSAVWFGGVIKKLRGIQ
ncbi:MAG: family 1 glycosylhydrolase [Candidatus Saccharibacteria bacterium]